MKSLRLLMGFFALALLVVLLPLTLVQAICDPDDSGGAGNDVITCTTTNPPIGEVTGGDGDDVITIGEGIVATLEVSGGFTEGDEAGNDTIINNGTIDASVEGDTNSGIGSGNDTIVNNGTVNNDISGDALYGEGYGSDNITNNGNVSGTIYGDSIDSDGYGSDSITNNGTANGIAGDSYSGAGSGDDTITNNGVVNGAIVGDSSLNTGSGNDTIINNGSANTIFGDSTGAEGSGNDTIVNNGSVDSIYADNQGGGSGSDTVTNTGIVTGTIDAGGGDDTVTMQGDNAMVIGMIDGGSGTDTLTFEFTFTDSDELDAFAAEVAAANPSGGTITFRGHTYVWTNFEELRSLLTLLGTPRLNQIADPVAVFCAAVGGIDVYAITPDGQGAFAFWVSAGLVRGGVNQVNTTGNPALIAQNISFRIALYALPGGELQVNQDTFDYAFRYEERCGPLPEEAEQPVIIQVEFPPFTIVNRPR